MNSFEPHITVATVVEQDGRFLMVREHAAGKLVLNQPAGHVEAGESLIQAAFRETLEETAWQVEITSLLGLYIYQAKRGGGVYYRICFVAKPLKHDAGQKLDTGIVAAEWLSADQLRACSAEHRGPLIMRCVDDYLSGRRLPLDVIYQHPWPLQKG
ncbi:MAG: NUDIX hydrolase [Alcanivoracaceae bacterium]|nr:NUDIX hydrolase [Alcanivoracaceae bacterium]